MTKPKPISELGEHTLLDILGDALGGVRGRNQQKIARVGLRLLNTLLEKNVDYGDSALTPPVLCPEITTKQALLTRMSDKVKRLISLATKPAEVVSESLDDTILDFAGYAILWGVEKERCEDETHMDDDVGNYMQAELFPCDPPEGLHPCSWHINVVPDGNACGHKAENAGCPWPVGETAGKHHVETCFHFKSRNESAKKACPTEATTETAIITEEPTTPADSHEVSRPGDEGSVMDPPPGPPCRFWRGTLPDTCELDGPCYAVYDGKFIVRTTSDCQYYEPVIEPEAISESPEPPQDSQSPQAHSLRLERIANCAIEEMSATNRPVISLTELVDSFCRSVLREASKQSEHLSYDTDTGEVSLASHVKAVAE